MRSLREQTYFRLSRETRAAKTGCSGRLCHARVQHRFCGIRDGHKIEAGCGIGEVSRAGYEMETS